MRFENKSVIITGGGGKIAKAYAMAFAKEGAKISLPDITSQGDSRHGRYRHQHEVRRVG